MVKSKYIILLFSAIFFAECNTAQVRRNIESNIEKYLDMEITFNQDTIVYSDEIILTVIFKNKSDSCISFYSNAKLFIDIYRPKIEFFECVQTGRFLTQPPYIESLTTLNPYEIQEEIFTLKVDAPLFSKEKTNQLVVHYTWGYNTGEKHKKNNKYEKCTVLYGRLDSSPFEIYVKEKEE
jgi:hypothetical protein